MKRTAKIVLLIAALGFAVIPFPLLSQTTTQPKPSFDVVSIKPSAPNLGIRGGGPRGDRFAMSGANLRMLLQTAYGRSGNGPVGGLIGQLQIIGGPNWIDSDRYDIDAKADCSGGVISRDQLQLMVQSMLEDRFQLKAHKETRELPIYNLVVGKDGPKLKPSTDQTPAGPGVGGGPAQPCGPAPNIQAPPPLPPPGQVGGRGGPLDPNTPLPRGAMFMMFSPNGMTVRASGVPIANLVGMLQQNIGRPIMDKTDLKGLFDFQLTFSPEGMNVQTPFGPIAPGAGPAGGGAGTPATAADPVPSLFTAIQELGLRLESSKGPLEVLVVDSAQKPTEN